MFLIFIQINFELETAAVQKSLKSIHVSSSSSHYVKTLSNIFIIVTYPDGILQQPLDQKTEREEKASCLPNKYCEYNTIMTFKMNYHF